MSTETKVIDASGGRMRWTVGAAIVALAGVAGSIWLSVGMNLKACPLCLYQRTFLISAAAVLLLGLATEFRRSSVVPLLSLPLVVGGFGVAAFHVYLESVGKLECPGGILGLGTAPQQSFAAFLLVVLITLIASVRTGIGHQLRWLGAILLGAILAVATIKSAPPMPPAPQKAYDQPLEICRPPYRPVG